MQPLCLTSSFCDKWKADLSPQFHLGWNFPPQFFHHSWRPQNLWSLKWKSVVLSHELLTCWGSEPQELCNKESKSFQKTIINSSLLKSPSSQKLKTETNKSQLHFKKFKQNNWFFSALSSTLCHWKPQIISPLLQFLLQHWLLWQLFGSLWAVFLFCYGWLPMKNLSTLKSILVSFPWIVSKQDHCTSDIQAQQQMPKCSPFVLWCREEWSP